METSINTRRIATKKNADGRFVVRNPSTLKDYIRIYRIKGDVLKKAKELEKALGVSA